MSDRLVAGLNFHRAVRGDAAHGGVLLQSRCSFCTAEVDALAFAGRKARVCEGCVLVAMTYYSDISLQRLRGGTVDATAALRRAREDHA